MGFAFYFVQQLDNAQSLFGDHALVAGVQLEELAWAWAIQPIYHVQLGAGFVPKKSSETSFSSPVLLEVASLLIGTAGA